MAKQQRDWRSGTVDIDFLLDSGLLFEINRTMLHPLGIAITVKVDANGKKSWDFKDSRAAPEELQFSKELLEIGRTKFENFMKAFGSNQIDRRVKKTGKVVQHVQMWTR